MLDVEFHFFSQFFMILRVFKTFPKINEINIIVSIQNIVTFFETKIKNFSLFCFLIKAHLLRTIIVNVYWSRKKHLKVERARSKLLFVKFRYKHSYSIHSYFKTYNDFFL